MGRQQHASRRRVSNLADLLEPVVEEVEAVVPVEPDDPAPLFENRVAQLADAWGATLRPNDAA